MKKNIKKSGAFIYLNFKKKELLRLFFRGVFSDLRFSVYIRYFNYKVLGVLKLFTTRLVYFCIYSNKRHGLVNFLKVYRMTFRENAFFTKYSGIKRGSW